MIDDKQLISKLLAANIIDQAILRQGLALADEHHATLYNALIFFELVAEHDVVSAASEILNVPCVDLRQTPVDPQVAAMISGELAHRSQTIPIDVVEDDGEQVMRLGMLDPIDVMAMDEIASETGVDIRPVLVGPAVLQIAIDQYYDVADEASAADEESEPELLELDDDEIIALTDPADEIMMDADTARQDPSAMPELIEAPTGDLADEDSWAAMFDEAKESQQSLDEESSVISQEMRDRPATGMFEVDPEEMEFEESDGPVDFSSLGDDSSAGTQVGRPSELGDWELDDAFDLDDAGSMRVDDSTAHERFDDASPMSGTQVGAPVDPDQWELDDGFYSLDDDDDSSDHSADQNANNRTQLGVATRSDLASYGIPVADDDDADGNDGDDVEEKLSAPADDGTPPPSFLKSGDSGAPAKQPSDDKTTSENTADDGEDDKKAKPKSAKAVSSSIRDALKRASARKKKKVKKDLPLPSLSKKDTPLPTADDDDPADNGNADDDEKTKEERPRQDSALGRIAVKKVAVPAFKGVVEKRSDRERQAEQEKETVEKIAQSELSSPNGSAEPVTREMSQDDLVGLAKLGQTSGDANGDPSAVQWPENLDATAALRGLVELLLERDVVDADEVQTILDAASD